MKKCMRIYMFIQFEINVRTRSAVTESFAAIVILCDDYSSMAGKTRGPAKKRKETE